MNKVFKVVWSATKHAYVVTSELAKSHQKSATTIVAAVILAASFSGGVANASSPEDWARADLIGSQRWITPEQNAWGHNQYQHPIDPQAQSQHFERERSEAPLFPAPSPPSEALIQTHTPARTQRSS